MFTNVHNEVTGVATHPRTHLCMYVHRYRVPVVGADSRAESLTVGMHRWSLGCPTEPLSVNLPSHQLVHPHYRPETLPRWAVMQRSRPALSAQTPLEMASITSYLRNFPSFPALMFPKKESLSKAILTADDVRTHLPRTLRC